MAWFAIATQWIIPTFSGTEAAAVDRYSYLGDSVLDIIHNLFFKPWLVLGKIFSLDSFGYVLLVVAPMIWGLTPKHLTPLISATPIFLINILSQLSEQRNLVHQYSLPILPFLLLSLISAMAAHTIWLKDQKIIRLWAIVSFLVLAKFGYFGSIYLESLDTWQATREAIAQINTQGSVLTSSSIAPHLTHRKNLALAIDSERSIDFQNFDYILLNLRHPGWQSSTQTVDRSIQILKRSSEFQLSFDRDDVFLFKKKRRRS